MCPELLLAAPHPPTGCLACGPRQALRWSPSTPPRTSCVITLSNPWLLTPLWQPASASVARVNRARLSSAHTRAVPPHGYSANKGGLAVRLCQHARSRHRHVIGAGTSAPQAMRRDDHRFQRGPSGGRTHPAPRRTRNATIQCQNGGATAPSCTEQGPELRQFHSSIGGVEAYRDAGASSTSGDAGEGHWSCASRPENSS